MLSFNKMMPFDNEKQSGVYRELKNVDQVPFEEEMDPLRRQPQVLINPNFDIVQLPNSLSGETKPKKPSWKNIRYLRTRFPRPWELRFTREPKRKNCKVVINNLKVILKNQSARPVFINEEGGLVSKKVQPKPLSKKAVAKISAHLTKPEDAKMIISMLKKEPHPSHASQKIPTSNFPLRGVCVRQSPADFNSQLDSADDMIDVTKALAMRVVPSSEVINLITGLPFGKLMGAVGESTGVYDALAMGTKSLIDRTDAHLNLVGMVPKDRVSVWSYWWGFEIAVPPPSMERLKQARSIETTALQILSALTVTGGAVEILPLIKCLSTFFDIEWSAISAENKGKGVAIAATWALPMALVPRPWDFDTPVAHN